MKLRQLTRVLLLSMLAAACMSASAKIWSAEDIPMIHLQDRMRYVCDPENLMSRDSRDSADFYLRHLEKDCGVQSVFVVVSHVRSGDCFRMAQDIGNKYGVGDKKTRRGLVVVIAVADQKYFIAPGKGLEGDLTDVECDDIAQACIVRNMKKGDLDAAVLSTTKAVYSKFKTGSTGIEESDGNDSLSAGGIILICLFCFGIPLFLYFSSRNNNRGGHNRHNRGGGIPPIIFFDGLGGNFRSGSGNFGDSGGSFGGGSFGGGSFGGGGSGGGW